MEILNGYVDGSIESIYHLGLVAGIYDSLHIGTVIDNIIPKKRQYNLSHGQVFKAMVLNGLVSVQLLWQYLEKKQRFCK